MFSFAASRTEGEGFSLDIFTHQLGSKPVCSLAEKLQLKMHDFGLLERRGKKSMLGCTNTRGSRSELRNLITLLTNHGLGTNTHEFWQRKGQIRSRLPQALRLRRFHLGPPSDNFRKGHFGCLMRHFPAQITLAGTYLHTHIHTCANVHASAHTYTASCPWSRLGISVEAFASTQIDSHCYQFWVATALVFVHLCIPSTQWSGQ